MSAATDARPSLWRPSLFAIVWHVCFWIGWAIVVYSVLQLSPAALQAMGAPLAMIAAIVVVSELRPIVMSRLAGNPVSISLAFVFATLYLWGLFPAIVLHAIAVGMSELLQRKTPWKVLFNVGQDVLSVTAGWLVLAAAGLASTPFAAHGHLSVLDLLWVILAWIVYHLTNLALVSALATGSATWWGDFSEEFWFYTGSAMAVLALSPLIAVVAVATPTSWTLLPLLLVPLLAVQKAAQMSRQQEHLALHDPLTGLPNRVLLADRIEQALARSGRSAGRVVVVFLDLDLFKVVNDSLGHHAGDALLVDAASRLRAAVRPGDTLARFGGDEFVIVCDDIPREEVLPLAERVRGVLGAPFEFEDRQVTITGSLGVALSAPASDAQTLLRDADAAMYQAKESGRDQVVLFDEAIHRRAADRLEDAVGLRRALDAGEFRTYFQPVMDLDTGRTVGLEALIRWQDPQRGLLAPNLFIPVAEETGLIVPLGYWVLDDALACLARWQETLPEARALWIGVNISARQLLAPDLVDRVSASLRRSGLPASAVRLEITESVIMNDLDPVVDALVALRELGLELAVDDFGTGYSSLSYLKQLPVTTVKIDRSFVDGLGGADDASDRPIVDAILRMAQSLRLDVIAEGVETPEQLAALRTLGGRVAQGYLWSPPLPPGEVVQWLQEATDRQVAG